MRRRLRQARVSLTPHTFHKKYFCIIYHTPALQVLLNIERRPAFNGYNKRPKDLLRRAALRQRHFEELQVWDSTLVTVSRHEYHSEMHIFGTVGHSSKFFETPPRIYQHVLNRTIHMMATNGTIASTRRQRSRGGGEKYSGR